MKAWVITLCRDSSENFEEKVISLLSARKTPSQVVDDLNLLYSIYGLLPSERLQYIKYKQPDILPVIYSGAKIYVGYLLQNHLTAYKAQNVIVDSSTYPEKISWVVPKHNIYKQEPHTHKIILQETISEKKYLVESIMPWSFLF